MCTRAAAQRKFLDLGGSAENQGDLRSVVLHKMTLGAQKSTFPIGARLPWLRARKTTCSPLTLFARAALGVRITGVDDKAFSQTGESYSMITMPNADSHQDRVLQEDNTELAYECSLRRLKPCPANHTSPCAPCPIGSRAQVPRLYGREP